MTCTLVQEPYSLDQTSQLLFITSYNFCVATIREQRLTREGYPLPQRRWRGCRCQEVNPKRHCHTCHCNGYQAWGIRLLRRCWRGRRWVGGEWTCSRRLLIHYTMLSTILLYTLRFFWYCHQVMNMCTY